MAQIQWNQLATPDFRGVNALQLAAQEQGQQAIAQLGKTVSDYQAANTKNNTDAIMNALYAAKTPEEFAAAQQAAEAEAGKHFGDYDTEKFRQALITQPGALYTQQQDALGRADAPGTIALQSALASGDIGAANTALNNLKSNKSIEAGLAAIQAAKAAKAEQTHITNQDAREADYKAGMLAVEQAKVKNQAIQNENERIKNLAGQGYVTTSDGKPTTTSVFTSGSNPKGLPVIDLKQGATAPEDVQAMIQDQVLKTRKMENSTGNPNATNGVKGSTISGVDQFSDLTFIGLARQRFPSQVAGMTDSQIASLKSDPKFSGQVAQAYHEQNAQTLANAGVPVNSFMLDASFFLDGKNAVSVYKAYQQNPNAPAINNGLSAEAIKDNIPTWKKGGAKDPSNPTVGDVMNGIAARNGVSLNGDTTEANRVYHMPLQVLNPLKKTYGNAYIDLGVNNLTGRTNPEVDYSPANAAAALSEWQTKNQGGIIKQFFGINSTSGKLVANAQAVPGFNELGDGAKLGVLKDLTAYNNRTGLFNSITNLSDADQQAKVAQSVSAIVQSHSPQQDVRKQGLFQKAILEAKINLQTAGTPLDQMPTDMEILKSVFGDKVVKEYKSPAETNITAAANATSKAPAITAPTGSKPLAKPVIPVDTPDAQYQRLLSSNRDAYSAYQSVAPDSATARVLLQQNPQLATLILLDSKRPKPVQVTPYTTKDFLKTLRGG